MPGIETLSVRWRLFLLAALLAAILNPGDFGCSDTVRRLQVARWIWRGEQAVLPGEGIPGAGGRMHAETGLGQSLLLLPLDIAATAALSVAGPPPPEVERRARILLIAAGMQAAVSGAAVVAAYDLLLALGFGAGAALAGALALLSGTTFLHYVQEAQENNLILLSTLLALRFAFRWLETRRPRDAFLAGLAMGGGLLVRLTTLFDHAMLAAILTLLLFLRPAPGVSPWRSLLRFALPASGTYALFVFCERLYHWIRFHELFSTYISISARRFQTPGVYNAYPFDRPFSRGFAGAMISADKSVFLFDPLLVLSILLLVVLWRRVEAAVRIYLLATLALLLGYASFYARFQSYAGDVSWGDRYLSTPVHLASLVAIPLAMRYWRELPRAAHEVTRTVAIIAVLLQAASTLVNINVEYVQKHRGDGWFVIGNRVRNAAAIATGRAHESTALRDLPPEWKLINFTPFLLALRYPDWARLAIPVWWLLLAFALAAGTTLFLHALRSP